METKILQLKAVWKAFSEQEVLQGISLDLKQGEIVALLGPSGSGKTTLFRLIAGLENLDQGEIYRQPGKKVAYVFQEPRLLPWKTVAENLAFVQENFLDAQEARERRESLLKLSGLLKFKDYYPGALSGGMRQRLELIRGLAIKPDLILMDEPFKSLDTALKMKLREMILDCWQKEGFSLFLITHDPEEALLLAHRIFLLSRDGKIKEEIELSIEQRERNLRNPIILDCLEQISNFLQQELPE